MLLEILIGFFAVLLTILAYYQSERKKFLIINFFAVMLFGISLILKGGYVGGLTSIVTSFLYFTALFLSQEVQKKLQYIIPLFAFIFYLYIGDKPGNLLYFLKGFEYLVELSIPIGSAIITYSIYQENIKRNKQFLLTGLFFWLFYSISIQSYWAATADLIGIIVLSFKLYKMR